jgi:hypothetical protein
MTTILSSNKEDIVSVLKEVTLLAEQKLQKLEKQANDVIPKIMQVGEYPKISDYFVEAGYNHKAQLGVQTSWFEMGNYSYGKSILKTEESLNKRKEDLLSLLGGYNQDCLKAEQNSLEAIQNNQKIHEKVQLMMQHIGIKPSYSVRDTKSRSMYPKYNTVQAGYFGDLSRDVPLKLNGTKHDVEGIKRSIEIKYNELVGQVRKAEQEENAKKAKAQRQHQIALLRAKYTPDDAMSSEWLIRDNILKQDKYLALAYYLEKNRSDWSDGCDYAKTGLGMFSVETEEDQKIFDNIQVFIEDWDRDGDGRCFRDCEYNYNVLYGMVKDEALLKDIELLKDLD